MFGLDRDVIKVSRGELIQGDSSVIGNQVKWKHNDIIVKLNSFEMYEDVAEVLCSILCSYSSIKDYVIYKPCTIMEDGIEQGEGCYCKNFLKDMEMSISFAKILRGVGIYGLEEPEELIKGIKENILCKDVMAYLRDCFCLDAVTGNDDRHLNNLLVVCDSSGTYKLAPIFDNGGACLLDRARFDESDYIEWCLESLWAVPICKDFVEQIGYIGLPPISIDYEKFFEEVKPESEIESHALNVIKTGMKMYKNKAWVKGDT